MSRNAWTVLAAIAAIAIVGLVVAALIVSPIARGPALRTIGDQRAFGGVDPHLHVAVTAWQAVGPVEGASRPTTRWMATVGVRNSASDIAIEPAALAFAVVTGDGREFPARALPATEVHGPTRTRLPERLSAGEAYAQAFVFDLPEDAPDPELWVWTDDWLGRLLPRVERNPLVELMRVPLEEPDRDDRDGADDSSRGSPTRSRAAQAPQRP